MPTTPHDATVFPEDTLYIKSPEETSVLYNDAIDALRVRFESHRNAAVVQYQKLTGTYVALEQTSEEPPAEEQPAEAPPAPQGA